MSPMGVLAHWWVAGSPLSWDWAFGGVFFISRILCDGLRFSVILPIVEVAAPLADKLCGRLLLILPYSPA